MQVFLIILSIAFTMCCGSFCSCSGVAARAAIFCVITGSCVVRYCMYVCFCFGILSFRAYGGGRMLLCRGCVPVCSVFFFVLIRRTVRIGSWSESMVVLSLGKGSLDMMLYIAGLFAMT